MEEGFAWPSFIEVPGFAEDWDALRCTDGDLSDLQSMLRTAPARWPVVPGAGGWRKMRFAPPSWGRGKSGSTRVYYAVLPRLGRILLGTAFAKTEMSDLAPMDKKALATMLVEYRRVSEGGS